MLTKSEEFKIVPVGSLDSTKRRAQGLSRVFSIQLGTSQNLVANMLGFKSYYALHCAHAGGATSSLPLDATLGELRALQRRRENDVLGAVCTAESEERVVQFLDRWKLVPDIWFLRPGDCKTEGRLHDLDRSEMEGVVFVPPSIRFAFIKSERLSKRLGEVSYSPLTADTIARMYGYKDWANLVSSYRPPVGVQYDQMLPDWTQSARHLWQADILSKDADIDLACAIGIVAAVRPSAALAQRQA